MTSKTLYTVFGDVESVCCHIISHFLAFHDGGFLAALTLSVLFGCHFGHWNNASYFHVERHEYEVDMPEFHLFMHILVEQSFEKGRSGQLSLSLPLYKKRSRHQLYKLFNREGVKW